MAGSYNVVFENWCSKELSQNDDLCSALLDSQSVTPSPSRPRAVPVARSAFIGFRKSDTQVGVDRGWDKKVNSSQKCYWKDNVALNVFRATNFALFGRFKQKRA